MMKTGLIATLIATILMVGMTLWTLNGFPENGEVPVHWNHKGEADRFAPVSEARFILWMLPGVSIFTSLVFAAALKIDPRKTNIEKSKTAFMAIWIGTLILMTVVTGLVCYAMFKGANVPDAKLDNMPNIIVAAIAVLLLVMGNYLPKTRSNWFFGIRTPWTLSSDESWEKTHRLAGRLFMGLGLMSLISILFLPTNWLIPLVVSGSLVITGLVLIYSYMVWKNANDRTPTAEYVD